MAAGLVWRAASVLGAALLLLLTGAGDAVAQGGAGPALVSVSPLEADPAHTLTVKVDGLDPAATPRFDPTTLRLRLNGRQFQSLKPERTSAGELAFDLRGLRDDKDGGWLYLAGSPPYTGLAPVTVALTSAATGDLLTAQGKTLLIGLRLFPTLHLALGLVAAAGIAAAVVLLGRRTDMLRDTAVLPPGTPKPYSLARCQMAWWFVLITACFIGIALVTLDTSHIVTTQSLTLLGISSATAMGSAAINIAKADAPPTPPPAGPGPAQPPHRPAQASVSFLRDVLTDGTGWAFHRVQALVWTVILGIVTLWSAYASLSLPALDANLLILMGISSGLYLGFKWPE